MQKNWINRIIGRYEVSSNFILAYLYAARPPKRTLAIWIIKSVYEPNTYTNGAYKYVIGEKCVAKKCVSPPPRPNEKIGSLNLEIAQIAWLNIPKSNA